MLRPLLLTAATVVAIWVAALGAAPAATADPPDINCIQVSSDGSCVYKNCTDAKAHGRCNIPQGDPAYCPQQDRDGDGLACEC